MPGTGVLPTAREPTYGASRSKGPKRKTHAAGQRARCAVISPPQRSKVRVLLARWRAHAWVTGSAPVDRPNAHWRARPGSVLVDIEIDGGIMRVKRRLWRAVTVPETATTPRHGHHVADCHPRTRIQRLAGSRGWCSCETTRRVRAMMGRGVGRHRGGHCDARWTRALPATQGTGLRVAEAATGPPCGRTSGRAEAAHLVDQSRLQANGSPIDRHAASSQGFIACRAKRPTSARSVGGRYDAEARIGAD